MTELKDSIQNRLQSIEKSLDEFQLQLALGKAEALDEFEKQKKRLSEFVFEFQQKIESLTTENELINKLKSALQELQLQLSLGKAESKEVFEEQKEKIIKVVGDLEEIIKADKKIDEKFADLYDYLDNSTQNFRTALDILRLQINLGKAEAEDNFEQVKKELSPVFSDLKEKINKIKDNGFSESSFKELNQELKNSFSLVKKVFSNLK